MSIEAWISSAKETCVFFRVQIANAMSLALSLGGADGKSGKPAIVAALAALVQDGINAEDVEALLKLTKVIVGFGFLLMILFIVNKYTRDRL